MPLTTPLGVWRAGLGLGLAALWTEPLLGLKRLILPVSYWRAAEFAYVARQLQLPRGARVLDLGSPKDLALLLAAERGFEVVATDILPEAIELSRRYAAALGRCGSGPGSVLSEVQDGRRLTYPDGAFDAAFSVSVLEHIPDDGDLAAARELARVVRPGGLVVVTTPYARTFGETYVDRAVYERPQVDGKPVFFERHYDDDALRRRLLSVPGTEVANLELWGEGAVRGERILTRLGRLRDALSPIEAFLSAAFLRRVENGNSTPMAAFFTLKKL